MKAEISGVREVSLAIGLLDPRVEEHLKKHPILYIDVHIYTSDAARRRWKFEQLQDAF